MWDLRSEIWFLLSLAAPWQPRRQVRVRLFAVTPRAPYSNAAHCCVLPLAFPPDAQQKVDLLNLNTYKEKWTLKHKKVKALITMPNRRGAHNSLVGGLMHPNLPTIVKQLRRCVYLDLMHKAVRQKCSLEHWHFGLPHIPRATPPQATYA